MWTQFINMDLGRALELDALDSSHPIEVCGCRFVAVLVVVHVTDITSRWIYECRISWFCEVNQNSVNNCNTKAVTA